MDVAATETRQIALNLLLNACEASPPGREIGFEVSVVDGSGPAGRTENSTWRWLMLAPGCHRLSRLALTEIGVTDPRDPPRGLGVRVVRDLVRGLGGRIVATAAVDDHGSRITVVTLPPGSRDKAEMWRMNMSVTTSEHVLRSTPGH